MNLFASIDKREARAVRLYTFSLAWHLTQLPRSRNVEHRQMQFTGLIQIAGESMLFSIVAGMCIVYKFSGHYLNNIIFYGASSTIEQLKDATSQDIQAINFDTLEKVFQNLEKRIQVCLDVKGNQFQHRLWAGPVLHRSRYVYINFQVIISIT